MKSINNLLSRLTSLKETGAGRWLARCPAHDDKSPSLSIRECSDGIVLVKCCAGCTAGDITGAVGLRVSDLFPPKLDAWRPPADGLTYAERRKLKKALAHEARLVYTAQMFLKHTEKLPPEDAHRPLIANDRAPKLRAKLGGGYSET